MALQISVEESPVGMAIVVPPSDSLGAVVKSRGGWGCKRF